MPRSTMILILAALLLCALLPSGTEAQQYTIKFATLATEGTTWLKVMREYDAAIRKESGGRMGFKIYAGGVQGEDKDMMRKIRLGQLHSAGVTGVGVGEVSSRLRILDSPFLFQNYADVDHLHSVMGAEFEEEFRKNDFILLGWAEVGFVYVYSNTPIRGQADMKGVKMWMWEGDQIAEAAFNSLGIKPIPMSVVDVLTSLQTGLINAAYTSPLAGLALQWNTRVKYMMGTPLADACGAVLISRKKFDTLPPDCQEILLRNGEKYMADLTRKSREENAASIKAMQKSGIQIIEISDKKSLAEFQVIGRNARQSLVGKLYDAAYLARVEKILADFRSTPTKGK